MGHYLELRLLNSGLQMKEYVHRYFRCLCDKVPMGVHDVISCGNKRNVDICWMQVVPYLELRILNPWLQMRAVCR